MDTKSQIIEKATILFQQKGYKGVGVNEILKACNITKGAIYHHFPNGKEEVLIASLQANEKLITTEITNVFNRHPSTQEAVQALIEKLVDDFDRKGMIIGYTFSSMANEIASLSDPVQNAYSSLYSKIQEIFVRKLEADGFSADSAESMALLIAAAIEGGIMLCLVKKSGDPLQTLSHVIPKLLKKS